MMSAGKKGAAGAVEEKVVELGEYKVNVASVGSGPTIVMLHGEEKPAELEGVGGLPGTCGHLPADNPRPGRFRQVFSSQRDA